MANVEGTGQPGEEQVIEDAEWEEIDETARTTAVAGEGASALLGAPAPQPSLQRALATARKVIKNVVLGWLIFTFSIGGLQSSCTSARRIGSFFVSHIDTRRCPDITGIGLIDHGPLVLLPPEMQWGRRSP